MRRIKQLKQDKQSLRKQLARLGIRAWRPIDVAWDYVIFYNDKIRQVWSNCNKGDPDEKGRVMRQIADLNHKRQQRLAEVDQLPDCPIWAWELPGWVESEYREALRPLETEAVEKPDPVEQPETSEQVEPVEQPESVVTQRASTNIGFLDHVSDGSEPIGDYDAPKADIEPTGSREMGGKTSFETVFEDTNSSQIYDADPPSLDAFEKGLFAAPRRFEPSEDINDDDDSLFGDPDNDSLFGDANNYQLDPTPVSCQPVEEAHPPEKSSHTSSTTQQAFEEKIIENYNSDSIPSIADGGAEPKPATAISQAAKEALICDDNTIADAFINQQVSQEQQAIEGYADDNDFPFSGEAEETDGPFAEPKHGTEIQLGPGVEALPTQESGISFDKGLGAGPLMPGQAGRQSQTATGAEPVKQVVLAPGEAQQSADQRKVADSEGGPPPFVTRYVSEGFCPTYQELATEMKEAGLEWLRGHARNDLCRFWPDGRQACTDLQLDLYATGVDAFKKEELERYEKCFQVGKPYVVEFQEEYEEIPPNKTLQCIFNGIALFHCLIDKKPEVVDLTEDDSISSTMAASFGVSKPALTAPAEVLAAGEPVLASADEEAALNGDEAPQDTDLVPKRVEKIHTPPPVDHTTFTQDSVLLAGNIKPTTPMQNDSVGNNGAWSSGWSGKAFSDGGEPPRTPSNQDVVVMERSVSTDNNKRKASTTDKTVVTKKARANTRAGAGSGSLSSTQRAHAALQDQLSQSAQAAGNVHGPLSAGPGPMAGPSTADTTERGSKRQKKNTEAATDPDASQRQQRSTPERQPAQYYGPSPEQSVDAKKWIEDHTQGGKGKKSQKRKAPEPKKTPTPRKARKTKEATPTAPRSYRNIAPAPAPARNHEDANDVQMQSRENTPMGHTGATHSSPDVQIPSNGTQMHSAAPHMPHGQPQLMPQQAFQNAPQQQYFQPPVGQQNVWTNSVQQHQVLEAENIHLLDRVAQLQQELKLIQQQKEIEAKNRRIAQLEQQAGQPAAAGSSQLMSYQSMPQGNWQSQQQSNWPSSRQGNVQPQSHGMASHDPYLPPQEYLQFQQWQSFPQQMSQPPMATPLMMSNQGMVSNGTVSRPTSMHEGYWQGPPPAGNPMARTFLQNGYPAPMNFSQGLQGASNHGMHGGFNGGAGGNHTEESMTEFGY